MTTLRRRFALLIAPTLALAAVAGCSPMEPDASPPPAGSGDFEPGDADDTAAIELIRQLPEADAEIALAQKVCPVGGQPLGSMGVPAKVDANGIPVFLCCIGCKRGVDEDPEAILARVPQGRPAAPVAEATSPEGEGS